MKVKLQFSNLTEKTAEENVLLFWAKDFYFFTEFFVSFEQVTVSIII